MEQTRSHIKCMYMCMYVCMCNVLSAHMYACILAMYVRMCNFEVVARASFLLDKHYGEDADPY